MPNYIREIVEQLAFLARDDKRVDKRSGVSQRLPISVLENVISNAERRALKAGEDLAVPRVLDIYAALPSITGKLELEYEGELKGGDNIARELIRAAVGKVYTNYFDGVNVSQIVQWFELGGSLKLDESVDSASMVKQLAKIQGLMEKTGALGLGRRASRMRCARRRPSSFWKDCTRIAASAAMKKSDSRPGSASAKRLRRERRPASAAQAVQLGCNLKEAGSS